MGSITRSRGKLSLLCFDPGQALASSAAIAVRQKCLEGIEAAPRLGEVMSETGRGGDRVASVAEPTRLSHGSECVSSYRSSRSGIAISSASATWSGSAMTDAWNLHGGAKAVALGAFKPARGRVIAHA